MKITLALTLVAIAGAALSAFAAGGGDAQKVSSPAAAPAANAATDVPAALNFTVKDIDGKDIELAKYKGKVLLILNVASKCGNTPQYTALEAMYAKYKDQGLFVMGFPANDFGSQEPGSNAEIKDFCESTYHVEFPMFAKVTVKGDNKAPLFKYLTAQDAAPVKKGEIAWNFEKFLISREGKLVGRFANNMKPDNKTIVDAVEAELKKQ